jgi:uncharacterized protein YuzE
LKLNYYPDTDSPYIDFSSKPSAESQEVSEGVVLDYDAEGNLVGIDIDNASRKLDLRGLVTEQIPFGAKTPWCLGGEVNLDMSERIEKLASLDFIVRPSLITGRLAVPNPNEKYGNRDKNASIAPVSGLFCLSM